MTPISDEFAESLTQEEKDAPTYLEWSDETLGRAARMVAEQIQDVYGSDAGMFTGAAHILIGMALKANAHDLVVRLDGLTMKGAPVGDWEVLVHRTQGRTETDSPQSVSIPIPTERLEKE